jgi:UDP-N-acetylglucosamine acyltransferase
MAQPLIHQTAIVDSKAEIDSDVQIGPYCTVGPHVKIGSGTILKSHVVVEGHTVIGKNNVFFPFAVIGAVPQDLKYKNEPTELWIGDQNTFRESITLNLGTVQGGGKTVVGNQNLLMAYTHLGHDVILGNGTVIANSVSIAGHVIVEDFAILGGLCGVGQFVRVGKYCYVGGMSAIDRDIPPFVIAVGERPCEIKGANIVGLRRKGFKAESISKINESIKLWKRADVMKEQSLLEIESQYGEVAEVADFISFIRKSENGCIK